MGDATETKWEISPGDAQVLDPSSLVNHASVPVYITLLCAKLQCEKSKSQAITVERE